MTSSCHHWGRSTARSRLWFIPLSLPVGVGEGGSRIDDYIATATHSQWSSQIWQSCANAPTVNGTAGGRKAAKKIYKKRAK